MADSFTWFEKFGDVCAKLSDEDRKEFVYAIAMYGMYGEEVDLPYPLDALFASVKDDVDNSKSARKSGSKGGRPKVSDNGKRGVSETQKRGVSETQKRGVSETQKRGVSETQKRGVSETQKRGVSEDSGKTETQYNTVQYSTSQSNTEGVREKRKRFSPPTREECIEFGDSIKMPRGESEKFFDHFTANGWKVSGKAPMRDWNAAMRNWKRNMPAFSASDAPKPIPKPVNAVDPDEELERLEREYREKFGEEP